MDYEFAGLPLHVLVVHATIVAIPLVSVMLVVVGAWPAARRVLWIPVSLAAIALVPLVQLTVSAGEWLQARVPATPLIQDHTTKGQGLMPWAIGLAVVGVALAAWAIVELVSRRRGRTVGRGAVIAASAVLTVAAVVVGAGATWNLIQIGEAGSRAVWEGSFSDEPLD
ncbi:hypothetical protein ACGGZK_12375 [Agromyces sp. MMS24-K17]|uniref:hypothetical protein n=1 Tax=Agromyces sp. MMS24-K17 TaxID=3372850 RepID=UPI003754CA4D